MKPFFYCGRRLNLVVVAAALLLAAPACQRHPYRIPDPQGPPQPKVKPKSAGNESADGRALDVEREAVRTKKNSLDKKTGLVKKPKYERRRLKRKVGQRKFLGFVLPF